MGRSRLQPIAARYTRIAGIYEVLESMVERGMKPWRERLWALGRGRRLTAVERNERLGPQGMVKLIVAEPARGDGL